MSPPITGCLSLLAALLLFSHCATSLIVPEELPTILSLVYSNIPPIKKGTDARIGVGFRLGEHADFQVLMELGPQKETDPIGLDSETKRKRAVIMNSALKGELGPLAQAVAKYQVEQKLKKILEKYKVKKDFSSESEKNTTENNNQKTEGSEWLSKWSQKSETNVDDLVTVKASSYPKIKPNINRIRVVNPTTDNREKNENTEKDLVMLKKLFEPKTNETSIT